MRIQQLTTQQAQVGRGQELATQLGNLFPEAVTEATLKDRSLQLAQQQALEESQLDKIQEQYQALIYEKQQLMTDGTLDELYQRQAILKAEIKELAQRWSGYQLAGQLLICIKLLCTFNKPALSINPSSRRSTSCGDERTRNVLFT